MGHPTATAAAWKNPGLTAGLTTLCQSSMADFFTTATYADYNKDIAKIPMFFHCGRRDPRINQFSHFVYRFQNYFGANVRWQAYRGVGHGLSRQAIRDTIQFFKEVTSGAYRPPAQGMPLLRKNKKGVSLREVQGFGYIGELFRKID